MIRTQIQLTAEQSRCVHESMLLLHKVTGFVVSHAVCGRSGVGQRKTALHGVPCLTTNFLSHERGLEISPELDDQKSLSGEIQQSRLLRCSQI